jgi:hypothetical protein
MLQSPDRIKKYKFFNFALYKSRIGIGVAAASIKCVSAALISIHIIVISSPKLSF